MHSKSAQEVCQYETLLTGKFKATEKYCRAQCKWKRLRLSNLPNAFKPQGERLKRLANTDKRDFLEN